MFRTLCLPLALVLAATGCTANQPPQPAPSAVADSTQPLAEPSASASAATSAAIAQTPVASPAPVASPLRDLAARYLESDGRGGWQTNERAEIELEKLGADNSAQLWTLLKDSQVEVRRGAALFLLGQFNPASSDQVAAFAALLDDSDRMVRARALDAVKKFARDDQVAVLPRLTAMLDPRHEDRAENRAAVARICGALRRDGAEALSALQSAAASDPNPTARAACLAAAAQVGTAEQSITMLSRSLTDNDAAVRLAAAARLRQLGPAAAPAANELANALADSDANIAEAAAEALIRIGSPAVEPLAQQLSSGSTPARRLALACLAKLGPVAKATIPAVEKCRQDADGQVRQLAETALIRLAGK
jgi:HEAT repeat protein